MTGAGLGRRLALIFLAALILGGSEPPFARGQREAECLTPGGENRFGVVDHLGWRFLYPPDAIDRAMTMMSEAGIGWVRLNWAWKDFQPQEGPFDFEHYDAIARIAAEHGVRILPILFAVPAWASTAPPELIAERGNLSPVDRYRPADLDLWLDYVRIVVERYDGDGEDDAPGSPRLDTWEVWNEQNIPLFWPPLPNVDEYVALLEATHETILAADPTARVVVGGLAGADTGYLQAVYDAGGAPYFDAVSVHAYVYPDVDNIPDLQATLEAVRAVTDANGDSDVPIWLTEIGWSDAENAWGAPTVSQEQMADFLQAVYTAPLEAEIIFWYNFRNIFDDSSDVEHNFGIIHNDFTPKPAYEAYAAVAGGCP